MGAVGQGSERPLPVPASWRATIDEVLDVEAES